VGIGTTAPGNKLTVAGAGGTGSSGPAVLGITASDDGAFVYGTSLIDSNLTSTHEILHLFGQALSSYNSGYIGFNYAGAGSVNNFVSIGIYGKNDIMALNGNGQVGIGLTGMYNGVGGSNAKLAIASTDGSQSGLVVGNGTNPRFALNGNSDGSWTMYDYAAGSWTGGITQKSGNVGQGITVLRKQPLSAKRLKTL
jgi:hypothetical protein